MFLVLCPSVMVGVVSTITEGYCYELGKEQHLNKIRENKYYIYIYIWIYMLLSINAVRLVRKYHFFLRI